MRNRYKMVSIILLTSTLFLLIIPNTKANGQVVAKDDYLSTGSLHRMEAHARAPGHLVYAEGAGGWGVYPVYLGGRYDNDFYLEGTRMKVHIYISAHYEWKLNLFGIIIPISWWGPPILDLIQWNGISDYGASTPSTVTWQANIGGQYQSYSMSYGFTYTANAYPSWGPQGDPSGEYGYYGYFQSQHGSSDHSFKALLKFDISNTLANEWCDSSGIQITGLKIKLVWKYYHEWFYGWYHFHTYTGNLHDEALDLPEILLYPGQVQI